MRHRWFSVVTCLLILALAQGCWGGPPGNSGNSTPTGAALTPTATAIPSVVPTNLPTPTTTTATPSAATPSASTTIATSPSATPPMTPAVTPTEPRLGLNPPGTPVQPGSPTVTLQPTAVINSREATINQVQGPGTRSPLIGQTVRVKGIVTADFQSTTTQGFYLQEDLRPPTESSTGIFVFQGDRPTPDVKVGNEVQIIGVVAEVNNRTQLDISRVTSLVTILSSGNPLPPAIALRPPPLAADAATYFERYEGMLVTVPQAIVVAPTDTTNNFTVIRADTGVTRLFEQDPRGTGWRMVINSSNAEQVAAGDQVDGLIGPLDYQNDHYTLLQLPEQKLLITRVTRPAPVIAAAGSTEFTVASFNLENFFDPLDTPGKDDPCDRNQYGQPCQQRITPADYALKLTKTGQAIRDTLGSPTLVAVQEVESLQVLSALATSPELTPYNYNALLLEGLDPRGINVGLLYRRDRVTVVQASQRNSCTTADLGFADGGSRCSSNNNGVLDGHWLAARPPLIVDLVVRNEAGNTERPLTLIINHWKSKAGSDPAQKQFTDRRIAEAQLVASIVNERLAANPTAAIMVVGDLNDFPQSEPLRVLTETTPLRNLATIAQPSDRYSYIYQGLSQILDHILVTPNLRSALLDFAYVHVDADYPASLATQPNPYRVSDHDPPYARFRITP